jgi:hypothetical protein
MNKSQRIYFDTGTTKTDKYIQVQLEQDVDTIEFMTMNLYTKDVYQDFNSDYGVLVGRVIANGGVGIPNAKISIFIPLTDEDANIGEIASIYPYKTPRDKNAEGKRYNLLPRVSEYDPATGTYKPKQPFGSFPIKPEIVTNQSFLDVYKKYYKYTALTNQAGDYMIFGVPVSVQTVHLSVDITDIGKYSMTPAAMVTNLGYSPNFFTDNNSKIKPSDDLTDLPNIETQEISVDIIPFWGDTTNFTIGITRQDFRIRSVLTNTFVIFGSVFTDAYKSMWGRGTNDDKHRVWLLYQMGVDNGKTVRQNQGAALKIAGTVTEKIYYYPTNITDSQIATGNYVDQMTLLDVTQYSSYKRNGDFAAILSCNRRKIVTDELGNETVVPDNSPDGIFTRFAGFMTLEISNEVLPLDWSSSGNKVYMLPIRQKLKFPQYATKGKTFKNPTVCAEAEADNDEWRKEHYSFSGGGIYSVSRFHGIVANGSSSGAENPQAGGYGFINGDNINIACLNALDVNAGTIQTNNYDATGNTAVQFPSNSIITGCANRGGLTSVDVFGANWMNLSVYLPQTGWVENNYSFIFDWRANSQFTWARKNDTYYMTPNKQVIAGKYSDTCSFARSDVNWTDFIPMTKQDIVKMNEVDCKGIVTANDGKTIVTNPALGITYPLQGNFRNGTYNPDPLKWCAPAPICGGRMNGSGTCPTEDPKTYFFKGIDTSDCVAFITCLGII